MSKAPNEVDNKCLLFHVPKHSGLPTETLMTIAKEMGVIQILSQRETRSVIIDFVPGIAEQVRVRPMDGAEHEEGYIRPTAVTIEPIPITFQLDDAELGGSTFVVIAADGKAMCRPFPWEGYEALGRFIMK